MFEALTHYQLQQYWWILVSLLAAFLVFLLFVQGGQTLLNSIAKTKDQRTMLVNSLGRKWEFTFTTLVTFGGAMFASFPKFYATSFGGAYWLWMMILFAFTIQAVSYEYRRKKGNIWGRRTYETFLFINGSAGVFLLGIAVGTFFNGTDFLVNEFNQSFWMKSTRGLEAILNPHNIMLAFTLFFLARMLGSMYFINNIKDNEIYARSKKQVGRNAILFLLFFLVFTIWLFAKTGYSYTADNVFEVKYKYFLNMIQMPVVAVLFLGGVALVLAGISVSWFKANRKGIWLAGPGTIMVVYSLLLTAGLNRTVFYPSAYDIQSSLTIENSSSSEYTLTAMAYVSLLIPFVMAYIYYAWRSIDKKKINADEINSGDLKY